MNSPTAAPFRTLNRRVLNQPRGLHAAMLRRILGGAALLAAMLYAVRRILTFVPQPLDAPGTLRPIFYSWYLKFTAHYANLEQAHVAWRTCCFLLLTIPPALAMANYLWRSGAFRLPQAIGAVVGSRILFFGAIAAMLLALRFPILLAPDLNPDETQFLASAEALFHDPVFFRSVDLGTSGPLNIFPLMLPAVFGISPDYVSGRLIGLLILFASVLALYRAFALLLPEAWARIAILPLAGFFAVLKQPDFVHYSSEHLAFLLKALAVWATVRTLRKPESYAVNLVALGGLISAASLAKWQALPGIACLTTIALAWVWKRKAAAPSWRAPVMVIYGLLPLTILNLALCLATGVLQDFWMAFVAGNLGYIAQGAPITAPQFIRFVLDQPENHWMGVTLITIYTAHLVKVLRSFRSSGASLLLEMAAACAAAAGITHALLSGPVQGTSVFEMLLAVTALGAGAVLLFQQHKPGEPPGDDSRVVQWFGFLTGASLLTAVIAVYTPRRPSAHYQLFLIPPMALAMAWPLVQHAATLRRGRDAEEDATPSSSAATMPLLIAFVVVVLAGQITMATTSDPIAFAQPATVRSAQGQYIEALVPPQEQISVWGYDARPYVDSGRTPATRDTNVADLFRGQKNIDAFYRRRFLQDLTRHPAALIVDARETSLWPIPGFETVPAINSFIQANYVYLGSGYGKRFYIRKDFAPGRH